MVWIRHGGVFVEFQRREHVCILRRIPRVGLGNISTGIMIDAVCFACFKLNFVHFFAHCRDSFRGKFLLARFSALSSAFVLIILTSDLTASYANRTRSGTRPERVRVRNKCERVTGPQPERFRSVFAGVNATRTSGTWPERDRNANRNRCENGLWYLCGGLSYFAHLHLYLLIAALSLCISSYSFQLWVPIERTWLGMHIIILSLNGALPLYNIICIRLCPSWT